jgi:DNA-binding NarL/FixJ family response regulator
LRGPIHLSYRQRQVIELLAAGLKNREIAQELGIGTDVIKNYVRNIFVATGTRNRVELALWYEARMHEAKRMRPKLS